MIIKNNQNLKQIPNFLENDLVCYFAKYIGDNNFEKLENANFFKDTCLPGGYGYMGDAGAGHFVKMVHNGIEYGDMQLICEAYDLLQRGLGLTADELHDVFSEWNKGELDSYLIEITSQIFAHKDEDGLPLVDKILDAAGQKGTGKWTAISALDLGQPVTLIGESVFARCLSALKEERVEASKILQGPTTKAAVGDRAEFIGRKSSSNRQGLSISILKRQSITLLIMLSTAISECWSRRASYSLCKPSSLPPQLGGRNLTPECSRGLLRRRPLRLYRPLPGPPSPEADRPRHAP